jgi:hypothetical protein
LGGSVGEEDFKPNTDMKNPFNPDHYDPEKTDEHKALHSELRALKRAYNAIDARTKHANIALTILDEEMDKLLAACPNNECSVCGVIICALGDEMHFHHDGCPSC